LLEHRKDRASFQTPVSHSPYLASSCPPIADSSQSRHSTALDHPTFLVDRDRCRAPACSNIGKIAHRSRHPFHTALISRRLVLPSPIPLRVDTRERSTTQRSSLILISSELLLAQTSERSPIVPDTLFTRRLSLFCLAPLRGEVLAEHFYPWPCHPTLS
jgi:hypothetical protein